MYFTRYEQEPVTLRVVRVDGELALGVYSAGASSPGYFILLEWEGERVTLIRDFRYVPYIAHEAVVEPVR